MKLESGRGTARGPHASKAGGVEGTMLQTKLVPAITYGLRLLARARFI
jgi:hypothetical protein